MRIEPTISELGCDVDWNPGPHIVDRQPDRPFLLTLVAIVLIGSGIGMAVLLVRSWGAFAGTAADIGLGEDWPYALTVLAGAYLFSGLLLISGAPAGWYLTLLLLTNGFLATVQGALLAYDYGLPISLMDGHTISWYTKFGGRAILTLLLFLYFFTHRVRAHYSVPVWRGALCVVVYAAIEVVLGFVV